MSCKTTWQKVEYIKRKMDCSYSKRSYLLKVWADKNCNQISKSKIKCKKCSKSLSTRSHRQIYKKPQAILETRETAIKTFHPNQIPLQIKGFHRKNSNNTSQSSPIKMITWTKYSKLLLSQRVTSWLYWKGKWRNKTKCKIISKAINPINTTINKKMTRILN